MDHTKVVVFVFVALSIAAPVPTKTFHPKLYRDAKERRLSSQEHMEIVRRESNETLKTAEPDQVTTEIPPSEEHTSTAAMSPTPLASTYADYSDQGIVVDEPPSTDELLETVLELLPVNYYMIAVSVANNLRYEWILVNYQNNTMTALPEALPIAKALIVGDDGENWTIGIFTYYIPETDETLAFLYDVEEGTNVWNVQIFSGYKKIDPKMITAMKQNDTKRGDNIEHEGDLGANFRFKGTMTYSCHPRSKPLCDPTLKIYVLHK